jgi:hypothetical protein
VAIAFCVVAFTTGMSDHRSNRPSKPTMFHAISVLPDVLSIFRRHDEGEILAAQWKFVLDLPCCSCTLSF